jgi:spore coat polysaccharide biosynthesis protein SpsF (cytidylyltransferase family)
MPNRDEGNGVKVVAIIQARMGSTRLPGKVMADVAGKAMLHRVVERVERATKLDGVVVATSGNPADDPIKDLCQTLGTNCFRGSADDVLDRYYRAALQHEINRIVRITADCPLVDPEVIDWVIGAFNPGEHDYVSNIAPPTFPDGLDVEVFSFAALERAWCNATLHSQREHVTLYIRNHPEMFRLANVANECDLSHLRWVVDEVTDLKFVREVYDKLGNGAFVTGEVLRLLGEEPHLKAINSKIMRNEGLLKSLAQDKAINES